MDGFQAFKYYTAVKQHFTNPKFDIRRTKGNVKCSREKFDSRNDRKIFERLSTSFQTDQQYIRYLASNFMYRCSDVIYDTPQATANFKQYVHRRESMTRVFSNDLDTILNEGARNNFSGQYLPDIVRLYLADKITLETLVILDHFDGLVARMREGLTPALTLMLTDELLRIERSRMFVKFDSYKVSVPYFDFLEQSTWRQSNGKDIQTTA